MHKYNITENLGHSILLGDL